MKDYFENQNSEIVSAFIKQFYAGVSFIPKELIVESEPEDKKKCSKNFFSIKRGYHVDIIAPQRGNKLKLVKLAKQNALEMISKYADKYKRKNRIQYKNFRRDKGFIRLR